VVAPNKLLEINLDLDSLTAPIAACPLGEVSVTLALSFWGNTCHPAPAYARPVGVWRCSDGSGCDDRC
jgi:hypothetical protein